MPNYTSYFLCNETHLNVNNARGNKYKLLKCIQTKKDVLYFHVFNRILKNGSMNSLP